MEVCLADSGKPQPRKGAEISMNWQKQDVGLGLLDLDQFACPRELAQVQTKVGVCWWAGRRAPVGL